MNTEQFINDFFCAIEGIVIPKGIYDFYFEDLK